MNKPTFIIGVFYTKDTPYDSIFNEYALPSLMRLKKDYNIDWRISVKENLGSWHKNVALKPLVISEMLYTLKKENDNRNLVFIDADSTINFYPSLFDELNEKNIEIAYHLLDWKTWYNYKDSNVKELLSGTLYLKNNDNIRELCQTWYECAVLTGQWEQKVLEDLVEGERTREP